jgi:Peptidase A4 family
VVRRLRLHLALGTTAIAALAAAPSALADSVSSSNWAGYAVHRAGVRFSKVLAAWTQPTVNCSAGHPTYSALWVGLGGYSESSNALEQIGSEVDCKASGHISSSAWYELVPAPSQPIRMSVRPGDQLVASVRVSGHTVWMSLKDTTTHRTFSKKLHASEIDVSSAEWIVEAPSECLDANTCQTLPLADFGSATFTLAQAQAVGGHTGSISDSWWDTTKIRLTPGGRRFVSSGANGSAGSATPSSLTAKGSSFRVTFSTISVTNPSFRARTSSVRDGYLVHPGR